MVHVPSSHNSSQLTPEDRAGLTKLQETVKLQRFCHIFPTESLSFVAQSVPISIPWEPDDGVPEEWKLNAYWAALSADEQEQLREELRSMLASPVSLAEMPHDFERERRLKVLQHFPKGKCDGFYEPLGLPYRAFRAWLDFDWVRCGKKRRARFDRAADQLSARL